MKKLLGICTLMAIILLSACGGSSNGEIVCTDENGDTISIYHEDGEITSFVLTETEDISDMDEDEISFFTAMAEAMPEAEYSIDGDTLTLIITLEGEAIQAMVPVVSLDLEGFIAEREAAGETCN